MISNSTMFPAVFTFFYVIRFRARCVWTCLWLYVSWFKLALWMCSIRSALVRTYVRVPKLDLICAPLYSSFFFCNSYQLSCKLLMCRIFLTIKMQASAKCIGNIYRNKQRNRPRTNRSRWKRLNRLSSKTIGNGRINNSKQRISK